MKRSGVRLRFGVCLVAMLGVLAATALISPSTAAAAGYPRYGQHDAAVWAVQKKLVEAGILRADLGTGYFGSSTRQAVQTVQRRSHLKATGTLDGPTARAIDRAVAAMTGPRTWYLQRGHRPLIGRPSDRGLSCRPAGQTSRRGDRHDARRGRLRSVPRPRPDGGPTDRRHRPLAGPGAEPGRAGGGPSVGGTTSISIGTSRIGSSSVRTPAREPPPPSRPGS